jgi:PAS domain S-box-containing protein
VKTPTDADLKGPPDVRARAEAEWRARHRDLSETSADDLARLVHDLEVHQIELEIQNEELRRAQSELEESRQELSDLYNYAPVGYLTIDRKARITQTNLTCAAMLGVERSQLVGQLFTRFLTRGSQDAFHLAMHADDDARRPQIVLRKKEGTLRVSMEMARAVEPGGDTVYRCVLVDITARHAAEEALRSSEERYRRLAEQVEDGIYVADAQGHFVDANRAACDMLGYTQEEFKQLTVHDVLVPEDRPKVPEQVRRLAQGDIVRGDWRIRRKDGSVFTGEIVARQLAEPGWVQGVVRDVTEQKRLADALFRQLAFETFLFELSRTFIGLPEDELDVNMERGLASVGEFLEMDRVTLFVLSRDRAEMTVPYSWATPGLIPATPVIAQRTHPWWVGQVLRGEVALASDIDDLPREATAEKEYLRQRGVASAASIPLKVGGEIAGAIAFVTVRRHVTWTEDLVKQLRAMGDILWNALRRRQALQAVRAAQAIVQESEERFRLAMSTVASGVYTLDLDGMITYVNPAAEAMVGWTIAELLGRKMHDVVHSKRPDGTQYPASECPVMQAVQTGIERREHEDTFIRKDGRFFPVVFSASPLKKDGTIVGIVVGFRDDTLRRDAERALREREALRASEDRYRGLAEQVVDGIIVTSAEGRVLDANRVGCELFGYTLEELRTLGPEDLISPEEILRVREMFQSPPSADIVHEEFRLRRGNGSVFTGEVAGRRLSDGRLQAVVRDVTGRKEAEEMQRRLHQLAMLPLEARMEDVFGAILDMAVDVSRASFGNIQLLDPKRSTLHIVAQRGFPQWWINYWDNVAEGRGVCGTTLQRRERVIVDDVEQSPIFTAADLDVQRQAGVRAVQSTPLVSRSGQLIGMLSTHFTQPGRPTEQTLLLLDRLAREAADIIGYAQAEAELKRRAALLDLAHDSIFVFDVEGHILYWNEGATRYYGWRREEALGRVSHELLQTQFPAPRAQILEGVMRSGYWEGELVQTCRDGRQVVVDSRWAIQPDTGGDGIRILEINSDITERKRRDQERADEARRKDEFLAFLGHELRNPLAAIHTAIGVLSGDVPPAQRARMQEIIGRQTAMMRRLVGDLLELERITHGHIELKRDRVDLAECLQQAAAAMKTIIDSRQQEFVLRLPPEPVQFMADGMRLEQILGNLLTNASKYTSRGGRIELSGASEGGEVVFRCRDNGQGIPQEYQRKIFDPFARSPRTTLGYGEASVGLGLALVKQLTELHGGTISVESGGTGLGSEFTVRLPLLTPAPAETPTPGAHIRTRRSIVVAEDNPSVAETLQAALELAGHSVSVFSDGPSTLAGVSTLKPDVILIDIGLPGMDGYELAARLKQHGNTKDARLIAVSGFKRREQGRTGDVFAHYFNKPVDVPALLALLDER